MRNPKPETNSNAQWPKAKNRQQGSGFGHSLLGAWGLFRASSFGFRVSALWMAVVPSCTPVRRTSKRRLSRCEQKRTAVVSKSGQFVVSKSGRAIKSGLLLSPLVAQSRADTLGVLHRRIGLCGDATRAPTGGL